MDDEIGTVPRAPKTASWLVSLTRSCRPRDPDLRTPSVHAIAWFRSPRGPAPHCTRSMPQLPPRVTIFARRHVVDIRPVMRANELRRQNHRPKHGDRAQVGVTLKVDTVHLGLAVEP